MNWRFNQMKGAEAEREKRNPGPDGRLGDLFFPSRAQIWGMLLVLAVLIAAIFFLPV